MTRTPDISILPMTEDDLDAVLEIENVSFPRPWTRDHFISEISSPHAFPLVALNQDGLVAGYICPMLIFDEGHIHDVAVAPSCRGLGIGRMLVLKVLDECREQGAEYVALEVRVSNESAIALYRQLGFVEAGTRKRYYENGEDALLMEFIFADSEES